MRARLADLAVAGMLIGSLHGCGGGSSRMDAAVDARDARADTGVAPDAPRADVPSGGDGAIDAPSAVDVRADQSVDVVDAAVDVGTSPIDSGASCTTQTVSLGRGGTSSSCSFKISAAIPRDQ